MNKTALTFIWILLSVISIALLTYLSVMYFPFTDSGFGAFFTYLASGFQFFLHDLMYGILCLLIIILTYLLNFYAIFRQLKKSKKSRRFGNFILSTLSAIPPFILNLFLVIFVSLLTSLLLFSYKASIVQDEISRSPESFNIATSTEEIAFNIEQLKDDIKLYDETCTNACQNSIVLSLGLDGKLSDFSVGTFLDLYTYFTDASSIISDRIYIVENNLIVNEVDSEKIVQFSKSLGEYLVQKSYPALNDTEVENFDFISKDRYLEIRNQSLDEYIAYLDQQLIKTNQAIVLAEQYLAEDQYYQQAYGSSNPQGWANLVATDQQYLNTLRETKLIIETYKAECEQQKLAEVTEWGVFYEPSSIYIISQDEFDYYPSEYFHILLHEYLHFKSYNGTKELSIFFEEGLTEYFSLKALETDDQWIFYADAIVIIEKITERISEDDLWEIYISKDEDLLEQRLDYVYGDGFYEKHQTDFNAIVQGINSGTELQDVLYDMEK